MTKICQCESRAQLNHISGTRFSRTFLELNGIFHGRTSTLENTTINTEDPLKMLLIISNDKRISTGGIIYIKNN